MKTTITPGQIIKTRSIGDSDCIFTIEILSRSENGYAMVKLEDQEKPVRRKIYTREDGREYVMAFGHYSMAPAFYAPQPIEKFVCECGSLIASEGYIGCTAEKCGQAPAIKNESSKAGQLAGKKEFFGTEGSSDFRFAVYPVHTRFDQISWFVADAEKIDADGKATIIRQESSREKAIASININGGKN